MDPEEITPETLALLKELNQITVNTEESISKILGKLNSIVDSAEDITDLNEKLTNLFTDFEDKELGFTPQSLENSRQLTDLARQQGIEVDRLNGLYTLQKDLTGSLVDLSEQLGRASIYSPESAKMFGETISESIDSLAKQGSAAEKVLNRITEIKKKLTSENPSERKAAVEELLSGSTKANDKKITEKDEQIETAKQLPVSDVNTKRIETLKAEREALEEEREKIAEAILNPESEEGKELIKTTTTQVLKAYKSTLADVTKGQAELLKAIKEPAQEILDNLVSQRQVLDNTVSLSDDLITGIGASAELRMKQAANSMQQADALQKQYDDMAETVGELQNIQSQGGVLNGQQQAQLAGAMREMNGIEASILSKRQEGLRAVKQLREGYLDALNAMQVGQGVFMEMVVSQDKNLGSLVRNIREVPRGLRTGTSVGEGAEKGQYGIGGLMGGTGANGEYDNKLMIDSNKDLTNVMKILSDKVADMAVKLPGMTALGYQGNKFAGAQIDGQVGPYNVDASGTAGTAVTSGAGGAGGAGRAGGAGGAGGVGGAGGAGGAGRAVGAGGGVPRVDTTGLSNAFRDALMSQVKPMSEVFKTGMEQVFSKAFEEFRNEITETIRR